MKKFLSVLLIGAYLLSACGNSAMSGHNDSGEGIEVRGVWARAGMAGGNSAAYMTLVNHEAQDDALVGVSSNVADAVEIHLSAMDANGVMSMTRQDKVIVPANGEAELKSGGYHVMIIGLKQDLKVGDHISLTLTFEKGGALNLTVPVQDSADAMDGMDMH
ncbi:MAG: copper chaperone PCu(A)C [Anaerolineales bacterium]|nr:copper chaperone PCu(A)C [Anaerolineales bacterium]